jgi:uncharacterized radical SAM superfamily Fe-S cluster-containing enzyme
MPARASEVNNVVWEDCKVFRQNGRLKFKESRIESTPSEDVANIFFAAHCGCACRQRADDISCCSHRVCCESVLVALPHIPSHICIMFTRFL